MIFNVKHREFDPKIGQEIERDFSVFVYRFIINGLRTVEKNIFYRNGTDNSN